MDIISNYVFIVTKHEIYKAKWNNSRVTLIKIKRILKYSMDIDMYLGRIKNTLPKILGKWAPIYNELRNI